MSGVLPCSSRAFGEAPRSRASRIWRTSPVRKMAAKSDDRAGAASSAAGRTTGEMAREQVSQRSEELIFIQAVRELRKAVFPFRRGKGVAHAPGADNGTKVA